MCGKAVNNKKNENRSNELAIEVRRDNSCVDSSTDKPTDNSAPSLKYRFLEAVVNGELGSRENSGIIVTLKAFKTYFSDIKTDYVNSFLPAATIETGQRTITHTKFLYRVKKGVYLVHGDVLLEFVAARGRDDEDEDDGLGDE